MCSEAFRVRSRRSAIILLAVYKEDLPEELEITAWTDNGIVMGVRHKSHPVEGIQFHPESIMTKVGHDLLRNFLES